MHSTLFIAITAILIGAMALSLLWLIKNLFAERKRGILLAAAEQSHRELIASLEQTVDRLRDERSSLLDENRELSSHLSGLRAKLEESDRKVTQMDEVFKATREQMEKDFQILADKIFSQKSKAFIDTNQEGLQSLLQPVREQLTAFRKKIEDVHTQDTRDRVGLIKEIEHLKKLNLQISEDAVNLATALKGKNKIQGLWGEMILERLLEDSGLKKGREYESQVALKDRNGKSRFPDVLVRLPEDRVIIIDAKVSLKAFEKACRVEETEAEQKYLQQHLDSLKKHIAGLSDKQYQRLGSIRSPDFVILFVPTEGAFQAAVVHDPGLLNVAMQKKIILASPATLMAILKIIHHMWRQDEQNRNSLTIAKQAGNLYDKFIGFIESFEEIGTRLEQGRDAWEIARKRLSHGRGNLISRAETLKELGIQSSKELPQSFTAGPDVNNGRNETENKGTGL